MTQNTKMINKLREQGYDVQIIHERDNPTRFSPVEGQEVPCTAITKALIHKNGHPICTGVSFCSATDQFCRKMGTRIALGRAIKFIEKHNIEVI